jgi:hypothetical protein
VGVWEQGQVCVVLVERREKSATYLGWCTGEQYMTCMTTRGDSQPNFNFNHEIKVMC